MGNVCSPSFSCDDTISRCLDCTARKAVYVRELHENLDALQGQLNKLIEAREDVRIRVIVAEQKQMKRLEQVQGWLSRVRDVETEAAKLIRQRDGEVEQLCLGGFCSKNCISSYKFGKKVLETLQVVESLMGEGNFKDVAQAAPENSVDERPVTETIVGLQLTFDKVWRCLTEEQAGIIGIYGMGGVGKTTLLTLINNHFLGLPHNFDLVIWVVVSKHLDLEKIQESVAKKIGLFNESWKTKTLYEKAHEIFKILSKKKFVLLLDDIWEHVDLIEVGLPLPSRRSASKVVFTTRDLEVCGKIGAHERFKVECLRDEDAWRLFEEKVGRDILDSHPNIPELAETVAKECSGLPLALIVVGRAMACKKTPQEWKHAIKVLKSSASKFSDMERKVYSGLKFSYDFLSSDTVRFCLLYCSLFPEDYRIETEELIDCWICEGFLDEYDGDEARNQGYSIIGNLVHACLLEEAENNCVKMHDVIRDMALWIASTIETEKEKTLVLAGVGLNQVASSGMWKEVTKMSLMSNKIGILSESPTCPRLRTLFLSRNSLLVVTSNFLQSMTSLRVLKLSHNICLDRLPDRFPELLSLQLLDLSFTGIKRLPEELKYLVNLKCLNLESTDYLRAIQPGLISSLEKLRILRMFSCGYFDQAQDGILFGGSELLVEELLGLKHLNVLTIDLRSSLALQMFFSSPVLLSSTRSLRLVSSKFRFLSLASLRHLESLVLSVCEDLDGLMKIDYIAEARNIRETRGFQSLCNVEIWLCSNFTHLTWLVFAPNLKCIQIDQCHDTEEIIRLDEVPAELLQNRIPFARLQFLGLRGLGKLKSISSNALPFPHLKEFRVNRCPKLKKLPLDCNSISERGFIIKGEESWWRELQWDDEATKNAFLPCYHDDWW